MVAGAGRECKENQRVRGYEGTAIYWRYGEVVEAENHSGVCDRRCEFRGDHGCGGAEVEPGGREEAEASTVDEPAKRRAVTIAAYKAVRER